MPGFSTDPKVKLLEGEVKRLKRLLDRMRKKVKGLKEDRKHLEDLVVDLEMKITEDKRLKEEVERLEGMNKLMWRRWKSSHPDAKPDLA
jgi:chromosome segregation ATPase